VIAPRVSIGPTKDGNREVMNVLDVLDDPRAGAAEFNALLPTALWPKWISPRTPPTIS
jgi:hypothetical protein